MKRILLIAGVAAAALVGGLFLRAAGPTGGDAAQAPAEPDPTPPPSTSAEEIPVPRRDVFRYDDAPAAGRPAAPSFPARMPAPEPPAALEPPAPEPVRLVGLVQRGGSWRAALSIHDDVVVLGVGESSGGYRLMAIDPAEGVTILDERGQERRLRLAEP